jgi:hypothetical protein
VLRGHQRLLFRALLEDIPSFTITLRLAGSLRDRGPTWSCGFLQRWPRVDMIWVDGDRNAGRRDPLSYQLNVPDLRATGASLCVEAQEGYMWSRRCGIAPGETVSLTSDPPPTFSAPASCTVLTPATRFTWSSSGTGIYELTFDVSSPAPGYPDVNVFTPNRSATWPDLRALGIAFPALKRAFPEGDAAYKCRIGLLQPYATMDDAAGPDGLAAPMPKDRRRSFSEELTLRAPAP